MPALQGRVWWAWRRVEQACTEGESRSPVPGRTRRRWRGRLRCSARQVLTVLMTTMHAQIYYDVASDGRLEVAWVGEHRPTVSEDA